MTCAVAVWVRSIPAFEFQNAPWAGGQSAASYIQASVHSGKVVALAIGVCIQSHHGVFRYRAYGAVAALDRTQETSVPTHETRVHNINFDLMAYGDGLGSDPVPQGFHLKLFGSFRHRYLALAVPKSESKVVKFLKVVLDQAVS